MTADDGPPVSASIPAPSSAAMAKLDPYLEIKVTPERATLALKANHVLEGLTPTPAILLDALRRQGAAQGIDQALVARIVADKLFDRTHIVAQAVAPIAGVDARIETVVKVSGEAKPVVLSDGSTDYRNVDNIQQVAEGAVLQIRHPATAGKPGTDVLGNTLPAKPGADADFKPGVNTRVSGDGNSLVATRGGYIILQGETLGVGESFTLEGDVNFKTGNILYHGDVHILGGVADGFRVEADGDIVVEGSVDGAAVISHKGGITLKGALFGHGRAELRAARGITLQAAQDARIEAGGLLTVGKELRLCHVVCGCLNAKRADGADGVDGTDGVDGGGCHVLGGTLVSYGETRLAIAGGEGVRTEIRVGDKAHEEARHELGGVSRKLEQLRALAAALEPRLKQFKVVADRMHGHLPVRMAADLKATVMRYAEVQKGMRGLAGEEARLRAVLATPLEKHWPVVIAEKIVDSVHVKLYGLHIDLIAMDAPGQWLWSREGILKSVVS